MLPSEEMLTSNRRRDAFFPGLLSLLVTGVAICVLPAQGGRVTLIGNGIKASASGVDVAGATFLMNDLVLSEGVVFAFSAYFRADNPVRFQIWRPVTNRSLADFRLLHELRVIPSVTNSREDVYMEALLTAPCPFVKQGDRLGIYMEEVPGSVAYTFDASTPMALGYTVPDLDSPTTVNDSLTFDTLTFPYDFSMSAFIDTKFLDGRDYTKETGCPKGLLIPPYKALRPPTVSPPETVTGERGATGLMGPKGNQGPVGPIGANGMVGATGPVGARGEPGPLADTQGATGLTGPGGAAGATGQQGMSGPPGATGSQGAKGRGGAGGATGPEGPTGPRGARGPAGPPGLAEISANSIKKLAASRVSDSPWAAPVTVMALAVWLGVLSGVLLLVAIGVCCRCCCRHKNRNSNRKRKLGGGGAGGGGGGGGGSGHRSSAKSAFDPSGQHDFQYVGGAPAPGGAEPKAEWMNSMREDTFKEYSIDTIDREPARRKQAPEVVISAADGDAADDADAADLTDIAVTSPEKEKTDIIGMTPFPDFS